MNRSTLIFIGIAAVIALIAGMLLFGRTPPAPQPADLEFWGIESEEVWRDVLLGFKEKNPHIAVRYVRVNEETLEENLLNRLAEGRGPDIFPLSNQTIEKHRDKIFPLPQKELGVTPRDFRRTFVNIAADDLITPQGEILGAPLYIDTLALFYNEDIFNAAGIAQPPQTWEETVEIAKRLTKLSPAKDVIKSGMALGTFQNISHAFEILSALMLQNGDAIIDRVTKEPALGDNAGEALRFYASFADSSRQHFSWSSRLKDSLSSFAEGTAAMAIGFSGDIPKIEAKNPHLLLGVAPLPQARNSNTSLTYGSYFFPTVSKFSKNPSAAWQFALYLASPESAKFYLDATGKAPARRDLIGQGTRSGLLETFYRQALIAKGWPVPDRERAEKIFKEAIEAMNKGGSPGDAIQRAEEKLKLLIPRE